MTDRPKAPKLEDVGLRHVQMYPYANNAMLCGYPFAFIEWGDQKFDIYCATFEQAGALEALLGHPATGHEIEGTGKKFHIASHGTPDQKAAALFMAFGGEGRSPFTEEELRGMPMAFMMMAQEAILAFLWVGPACAQSEPVPDEIKAQHKRP